MERMTLVQGDALDFEAYAELQKSAYAEWLARQGSTTDFMTPAFYRWKYNGAHGTARIALAMEGDRMLAANAMFPVTLCHGGSSVRAWQSCDTATLPECRGRGHFQKCLAVLGETFDPGEVFFGFPNVNSMRGFQKIGWEDKGEVRTWVNPLGPLAGSQSSKVTEVTRFDAEQDRLADRLLERQPVMIRRDAAYLNWRYLAHPNVDYRCFALVRDGATAGFAVVRSASVGQRRPGLVMEAWAAHPRDERTLLRHAAAWARREGHFPVVALDTALATGTALSSGFAPVPARFLSKRQVLMGSVPVSAEGLDAGRAALAARWRVQLGDWDAF